jgi:phosphoribosylglycinamide formyltransferase-1
MNKVSILVSGNGSNMQAIVNAAKDGILKNLVEIVLVISNNPNAFAIKRAQKENIKTVCIEKNLFNNSDEYNKAILNELQKAQTDIVCLAGYMTLISKNIIAAYHDRILNIHPSLLPKFGGKGMYGHFVHDAVIASKEKKSGATVHFVNENYDTGKIIIQQDIDILETDTAETLAKRVLKIEHQIYPLALKSVISNNVRVNGQKVQNVKGYIIHVKTDEIRRKHMEQQIKNLKFKFDFILDGEQIDLTEEIIKKNFGGLMLNILDPKLTDHYVNLGTASCTYKHLLAYRDLIKTNFEFGIVFENDAVVSKNFNEVILQSIEEIKRRNLKNVFLSLEDSMLRYVPRSKRIKGQFVYRNPRLTRFAGAYLFDRKHAENIIDYVNTTGCNDVIDHFINRRDIDGTINIYWIHPTVATGGTSCGKVSSYFECRKYSGIFRLGRRISFSVQRVYKKILYYFR